ncbi:PhzF family phenazine biosynthesis protein [Georgenia thermotolerans]|uniref:PhzF family phenazine biosynthesis protein n=1 Tax=Georgenia thermotolerans TaxID=527326 RepID=UPI001D00F054|nr:PhzF family phenazine biosynthesis protein [Georgenia thermotolerans]
MRTRPFAQVNVFSTDPVLGNPVAVVVDGSGLTDAEMRRFASWTNLSETTFLLEPTTPEADYRVRIFTPTGEYPFAGHPTLGSAHAWLEAGGRPRAADRIVQECGAGLVTVREDGGRWAFAGPPLTRYERPDDGALDRAAAALRIDRGDVLDASWLVNGPDWLGLRLASAEQVLAIRPDPALMDGLKLGVVGPLDPDPADPAAPAFEVRALKGAGQEDPATGSLNAGVARWLMDTGVAPERYVAAQGTALGRAGRVHVCAADGEIWVGGATTTVVGGTVAL